MSVVSSWVMTQLVYSDSRSFVQYLLLVLRYVAGIMFQSRSGNIAEAKEIIKCYF